MRSICSHSNSTNEAGYSNDHVTSPTDDSTKVKNQKKSKTKQFLFAAEICPLGGCWQRSCCVRLCSVYVAISLSGKSDLNSMRNQQHLKVYLLLVVGFCLRVSQLIIAGAVGILRDYLFHKILPHPV